MGKHHSGSREWLTDKIYPKWEIIRRHTPYREFCDRNHSAFEEGVLTGLPACITPEATAIMDRYGLTAIVHYREDTPPPFKRELSVEYIYPETEPKDGILELSPLWDEHYIKLKIDISGDVPVAQLGPEFTEFVEQARQSPLMKRHSKSGTWIVQGGPISKS
jgi:hypothetical protein